MCIRDSVCTPKWLCSPIKLSMKVGCCLSDCRINWKIPEISTGCLDVYKRQGNICMDVCMIDVTDIDCREGDKAVIFGDDLPITTLSDKLGTIPYEVLTSISNRVKRVYYQD